MVMRETQTALLYESLQLLRALVCLKFLLFFMLHARWETFCAGHFNCALEATHLLFGQIFAIVLSLHPSTSLAVHAFASLLHAGCT